VVGKAVATLEAIDVVRICGGDARERRFPIDDKCHVLYCVGHDAPGSIESVFFG
jgi:hypothetical protein